MATGFFYKSVEGPLVEPGEYNIEVAIGDDHASTTVRVADDPAVTISAQDRKARSEMIARAYALYKSAYEASVRFKAVKSSLAAAQESLKEADAPKLPDAAKARLDDFSKKVEALAPLFVAPSDPMNMPAKYVPPPLDERIARVLFIVESYTAAPRKEDADQMDALVPLETKAEQQLRDLIDIDMTQLNQALHDANLPYVRVPSNAALSSPE
jgi:hypothetical protein